MKKLLCLLSTTLMMFSCVSPVMANDNIKVRVGGELVKFDVQPQLINDRTMVPLRAIFEALGATVEWDDETKSITSTKGDTTILLTMYRPLMFVNEKDVSLDTPPCLIDGRTLVPVRAISEAFNLKVDWDGANKTVRIRKKVSLPSENCFYGITWHYKYDENGNEIYRENNYGLSAVTEYDMYDNITKDTISNGDSSTYEYKYDEYGNVLFQQNSDGEWIKSEYNDNGKEIFRSYSGGNWVKYEYDENNNLIKDTSSNGDTTTYEYDNNNNLIMTYSGFFTQRYEYDNNNNLISRTDFYDDITEYTTFEYDEDGNLIYMSDNAGNYTKYDVVEL